ncbi:MAG: thiamine phosphate synthase [Firmicutes bacterium]|nr:thiamine phosphate synthase [Bacillota bacterium]
MCSFKRIAISNRHICRLPLPDQVRHLAGKADILILREKDMQEAEYEALAARVQKACRQREIVLICHTFVRAAQNIGCPRIHLPFLQFMKERPEGFEETGVSVHSLAEALAAQQAGADYLIAGNIFETQCKPGLAGKGLEFLREICEKVGIPVYGLGGITDEREEPIQRAGAAGACRMSGYMKI